MVVVKGFPVIGCAPEFTTGKITTKHTFWIAGLCGNTRHFISFYPENTSYGCGHSHLTINPIFPCYIIEVDSEEIGNGGVVSTPRPSDHQRGFNQIHISDIDDTWYITCDFPAHCYHPNPEDQESSERLLSFIRGFYHWKELIDFLIERAEKINRKNWNEAGLSLRYYLFKQQFPSLDTNERLSEPTNEAKTLHDICDYFQSKNPELYEELLQEVMKFNQSFKNDFIIVVTGFFQILQNKIGFLDWDEAVIYLPDYESTIYNIFSYESLLEYFRFNDIDSNRRVDESLSELIVGGLKINDTSFSIRITEDRIYYGQSFNELTKEEKEHLENLYSILDKTVKKLNRRKKIVKKPLSLQKVDKPLINLEEHFRYLRDDE